MLGVEHRPRDGQRDQRADYAAQYEQQPVLPANLLRILGPQQESKRRQNDSPAAPAEEPFDDDRQGRADEAGQQPGMIENIGQEV